MARTLFYLIKFYKEGGGVKGGLLPHVLTWRDLFLKYFHQKFIEKSEFDIPKEVKTQMMAQLAFDIVTTHFMSISIPPLKLSFVKILCLACICKQLLTAIQSSKLSVSNIKDNE